MIWTIGVAYTLAWLASPWIVTGLTLSLGTTILKSSTSALVYAGKRTYFLVSGSSGYDTGKANSKDDAFVVLDHPTYFLDKPYHDHIRSYYPRGRHLKGKRYMSI